MSNLVPAAESSPAAGSPDPSRAKSSRLRSDQNDAPRANDSAASSSIEDESSSAKRARMDNPSPKDNPLFDGLSFAFAGKHPNKDVLIESIKRAGGKVMAKYSDKSTTHLIVRDRAAMKEGLQAVITAMRQNKIVILGDWVDMSIALKKLLRKKYVLAGGSEDEAMQGAMASATYDKVTIGSRSEKFMC